MIKPDIEPLSNNIQRAKERLLLMEKKIELQEGLPFLYGWNWYKWAREFYESRNKINLLCAANQISKAMHVDSEIPTPEGFKKLGDLQIGDQVFGRDGKPTRITDIPYLGADDEYQLTFSNGSKITCSKNHVWVCKGPRERFRKEYATGRGEKKRKFKNETYGCWVERTLEEIIVSGGYIPEAKPTQRFVIPVCSPVEYPEKELFDPYFLGVYIGNGGCRAISLHSEDTEIRKVCERYGNKLNISTGKLAVSVLGGTFNTLRSLGLVVPSHQKFIPKKYLFGSIEQRKSLLAGLMDTDGTCGKTGQDYNYCTTSQVLAHQLLELTSSLGGIGQIKKYPSFYYKDGKRVDCRDHYVITIWTTFNPFRSKRKAERWRPNTRYRHERVITKIEKLPPAPMKCITVDNEDGTFLVSRNYVVTHNSSTQIRKCINWATNTSLWPSLWPKRRPAQFWYLYPSANQSTIEFETKWQEFLPQGKYKDDPLYGWHAEKKNKDIFAIHFNSGIHVYFKSYKQDISTLQTGSCDAIFADEEVGVNVYDELIFRISSTDGFFHMVFTATMGQEFWRKVMEPGPREVELLPDAAKWTVSMYDCLEYEDGSPSHWTLEKISKIKARCKSEAEILRRVYGRFIKDKGLKYPQFEVTRHLKPAPAPPPKDWFVYVGADPGSGGGGSGHPAALIFVAVRPDMKFGRVFLGWRGDGVSTTSGDVVNKYMEMKREHGLTITQRWYDWADKDFDLISTSMGEPFQKAEKGHEKGESIVNVLFKNDMLIIDEEPELQKLANELMSLSHSAAKNKSDDDLTDALRYCVTLIPWDFEDCVDNSNRDVPKPLETPTPEQERTAARRAMFGPTDKEAHQNLEDEFSEWNELYGE